MLSVPAERDLSLAVRSVAHTWPHDDLLVPGFAEHAHGTLAARFVLLRASFQDSVPTPNAEPILLEAEVVLSVLLEMFVEPLSRTWRLHYYYCTCGRSLLVAP